MAKYYYDFHEERGEYRGYVEDANGKDVWRVTYPDFYEDEENGELVESSTIFEDGYMKDTTDIEGLEDYLKKMGILKSGDELEFVDDDEENYAKGGGIDGFNKGDKVILKFDIEYRKGNEVVFEVVGFDDDKLILEQPNKGFKSRKVQMRSYVYPNDVVKYNKMAEGGTLNTRVINKIKAQKPFELPLELSVYVPSTEKASQIISKREYNQRIEEVQEFLAKLFGGFSSVSVEGGYVSDEKGLINEDVTRVVAFASKEGFEPKLDTLLKKIVDWCAKWSQESIGFEFEGDLFYIEATSKFNDGGETDDDDRSYGRYEDYDDDFQRRMNLKYFKKGNKASYIGLYGYRKLSDDYKDLDEDDHTSPIDIPYETFLKDYNKGKMARGGKTKAINKRWKVVTKSHGRNVSSIITLGLNSNISDVKRRMRQMGVNSRDIVSIESQYANGGTTADDNLDWYTMATEYYGNDFTDLSADEKDEAIAELKKDYYKTKHY